MKLARAARIELERLDQQIEPLALSSGASSICSRPPRRPTPTRRSPPPPPPPTTKENWTMSEAMSLEARRTTVAAQVASITEAAGCPLVVVSHRAVQQ
ncbi:MAG TPA: hypothetical protein VEL79_16195 [Vicinamibacterales bacterium]|nr:hypothetical protein [Vicinamibacterales bacterium]